MRTITRMTLCACAGTLAIAWSLPALAQQAPQEAAPQAAQSADEDQSVLSGEIVVTAQKRQENVQNVGIAITAYSGDQLRALGIQRSSDVAGFSPGVSISGSLAGQNTQFTIRGVVQNDFNDIVEAPNAVYLDEGYIAIAQGQSFAVFDIDRVEVLKGPQGTLFGRNATGGLIHYISHLPSLTKWEGYVDARYGIMDSTSNPGVFTLEGAVGGPISDKVAVRAAGRWNKQEPYLKNLYPLGAVGGSPGIGAGADLGDDDTLAGRFTILAEPTSNTQFILSANGSRSKVNTGPYTQKATIAQFDANGELINVLDVGPNETRASIGVPGGPRVINGDAGSDLNNDGIFGGPGEIYGRAPGADFFGYRAPDPKTRTLSSDFAFENQGRVDTWGVNLRAKIDLSDDITLSSVTDYKNFKKLLFIDVDAGPANQLANYGNVDANSFTQELRLNGKAERLTWAAGVFFLHIDNLSKNGLKAPANGLVPGNPIDIASTARLKTDSYSAFGQVDYDFTDKFRMVVGARVIREKKDYDFIQQLFVSPDPRVIQPAQTAPGFPLTIGPTYPGGVPTPYADKNSETLWAGKVQFEYRPAEGTLLYAGINRGVKAGSYNAQLNGGLATPDSAIRYGAETLWSYEGGFKISLLDNKVRLNGAVYYYDYKNNQSFLFTGVAGLVINADARTYGAELSLQANPIPGLDMALTFSQFNARVKDVPLRVGGPIRRDLKPTYAPETQASGIIRYGWDMFGGEMAANANISYSSSFFYNLRNFDADKFGGFANVDLGLGWTSPDKRYEVGVRVDNATNKLIGLQGYNLSGLCGCNEVSYRLPRTFSVRTRVAF